MKPVDTPPFARHPVQERFRTLSAALQESYNEHPELIGPKTPSRIRASAIIELIDALRALIFPGFFGNPPAAEPFLPWRDKPLERLAALLHEQIASALAYKNLDEREAFSIVCDFLERIPAIQ